jgi:phosphate transport system ATP-binding protein
VTDPSDTTTMTDDIRTDTGAGGAGAPRAPLPARSTADAAVAAAVPTTAAPGISVTGLNAYYGAGHAIKDVSIEYVPNKVTAMIGPSGSGKSTVLRCLNRMHEEIPGARAEGTVMLDDHDIYAPNVDVVAVRRAIGMVFQKPNPFPTMSIFDNVAAGLKLNGVKGVDLKERVEQSLRGCTSRASASPAASSSACASRARSPSSRRSSSWTSRARRSTRSRR